MNPILQALNTGYKAKNILDYISKLDPALSAKIALALSAGHTAESVLKYVYRGGNKISQFLPSTANDNGNEFETAVYKTHPGATNLVKGAALGIGAGLAGNALKNYLTTDMASNILPSEEQPQIEPQTAQSPLQISQQTDQLQQGMQQQAVQRATGIGIPQSTNEIAAQAAMQPQTAAPVQQQPATSTPQPVATKPALQIAQDLNLVPHIQSLMKNYKDPSSIAAVLYNQYPREMDKLQKDSGMLMEDAIHETMQSIPQPVPEIKEQPVNVGSKVITPSDEIGEIEKISGKTAQIKTEEGKIGAPLDKAIPVTEEYNEVLDNYKKLIESIPEEHKSAVVNFIGYDPDRRKLSVRFHGGDQYNYEDLQEEDVQKIADAFHLAKTSGENVFGAWSPNDPSRGAGIHKMIMELQKKYGGKGKEYSAKFKTLYDYFALPKQMLAEEEKRKKDEERARKKAKKEKR